MNRPPVPGSVTLGRVLLIIESVLWLLLGLLAGLGGALWFAGVRALNLQQYGTAGNGVRLAADAIGGVLIGFGVVVAVLAILGIWSGAAMGRLTGGPRVTGIVLACLGIVIGLFGAIGGSQTFTDTTSGSTIRGNPIFGLVLIVLNLIIVWALGFAGSARAAFRRLPPPGYAAAGPYIPPGYPAWPQAQPGWPTTQQGAPPPPPPAPPGYPPPPPAAP
ncbi:MAG: hypothetical protein WCB85_08245 [Candidatus Dormiibacterota bacterium]